jgi:hypothetical protein
MKKNIPDNVVFSEDKGYHANILPYGSSVAAPAIKVDDVIAWKSRNIHAVNKEFENKFNELKFQYQKLMEEYEWNELVYSAKYAFEPIIGEVYHVYQADDFSYFLSLIAPQEWNKTHIGTFLLNSDKKWIKINS